MVPRWPQVFGCRGMMGKREGKVRVAMGKGWDIMSSSHPQGIPELLMATEIRPCNPSWASSDFISRQLWRSAAPAGPASGREWASQGGTAAPGREFTALWHQHQDQPWPPATSSAPLGCWTEKRGWLVLSLAPTRVPWLDGVCWMHPAGSGGAVRGAEDRVNLGYTRNFLHPRTIQLFFDDSHAMSCVGLSPGAENTAEFNTFILFAQFPHPGPVLSLPYFPFLPSLSIHEFLRPEAFSWRPYPFPLGFLFPLSIL